MPWKPKSFRLTPERNRHKERDALKGDAAARGYDSTWRKLRNAFIAANPLCRMCEAAGRVTPAAVVDHIEPVDKRPDLRLVESNLQSLCHSCHTMKTNRDKRGG